MSYTYYLVIYNSYYLLLISLILYMIYYIINNIINVMSGVNRNWSKKKKKYIILKI